jgi:hypothetical protein
LLLRFRYIHPGFYSIDGGFIALIEDNGVMAIDTANDAAAARFSATTATIAISSSFETGAFSCK